MSRWIHQHKKSIDDQNSQTMCKETSVGLRPRKQTGSSIDMSESTCPQTLSQAQINKQTTSETHWIHSIAVCWSCVPNMVAGSTAMQHNHLHWTRRFEKFKARYSVLHKTVNSRTRKSTELEKTLKNLNQTLLAEKIKLERQNIARLEEDQVVGTLIREKEHVRCMLFICAYFMKVSRSCAYAHFHEPTPSGSRVSSCALRG